VFLKNLFSPFTGLRTPKRAGKPCVIKFSPDLRDRCMTQASFSGPALVTRLFALTGFLRTPLQAYFLNQAVYVKSFYFVLAYLSYSWILKMGAIRSSETSANSTPLRTKFKKQYYFFFMLLPNIVVLYLFKYYFWTLSIVLFLFKNNVSDAGFCLRLQVKLTEFCF
jgi:hypothetical protein